MQSGTIDQDHVMKKIQRTATAGMWLSTLASGIGLIFIFYFMAWAMTDHTSLMADLNLQLNLSPAIATLSQTQATIVAALWLITDILGVVLMMTIRQLFVGIKKHGIFTRLSAMQLRRIGWMVFALGPVSIVLDTVTEFLMTYWAPPEGASVSIGFEDSDIYAIVIGLVIVAVAHIMVSAAQLSEDHRAFV